MKTREGYINYDQLWLGLFKALYSNSRSINGYTISGHLINGHLEAIESLAVKNNLSSSPFPWDKREEKTGDTLLITAAHQQNLLVVERLIKNGASVHIRNNENHTALYQALKNNQIEMAMFLLLQGATFAEMELHTLYSLLSRARAQALDWLKLLDKYQMDVTIQDHTGNKLMDYAVKAKNFYLIDLLLTRKIAFPAKQVLNEFKTSSSATQTQWVDFSIKHKIDLDSVCDDKYTALYYCASNNNVSSARKLLEAKVSTQLPSMSFFPYNNDYFELAQLLSKYKFPFDQLTFWQTLNTSPFSLESIKKWARISYNKSMVLDLALSYTAHLNEITAVKFLLQSRANPSINYETCNGFNKPIDSAIRHKNLPMIRLLISKNAVANPEYVMQLMYSNSEQSEKNWFDLIIPLSIQRMYNNAAQPEEDCLDLIILLREKNPHLNISNIKNQQFLHTPFIAAAYLNDLDRLLKLLHFNDHLSVNLEEKNSIPILDLKDYRGKSALDYGIKRENIDIIHALLSHGAAFDKEQEDEIDDILSICLLFSDSSIRYAAISCLNILYLKKIDKEGYKKELELELYERSIAEIVTEAMPKDGFRDPNRLISEYLFFHSKSSRKNEKEKKPSPQEQKNHRF